MKNEITLIIKAEKASVQITSFSWEGKRGSVQEEKKTFEHAIYITHGKNLAFYSARREKEAVKKFA